MKEKMKVEHGNPTGKGEKEKTKSPYIITFCRGSFYVPETLMLLEQFHFMLERYLFDNLCENSVIEITSWFIYLFICDVFMIH